MKWTDGIEMRHHNHEMKVDDYNNNGLSSTNGNDLASMAHLSLHEVEEGTALPTGQSPSLDRKNNGPSGGNGMIHRRRQGQQNPSKGLDTNGSSNSGRIRQQNGNKSYRRRIKKRRNNPKIVSSIVRGTILLCGFIVLLFFGRIVWLSRRQQQLMQHTNTIEVVPWIPHQYHTIPIARMGSISYNNTISSDNEISVHDWKNGPIIHIVNSRFMQEQGQLYNLGMARLLLFQTVCLPSMIHQSIQNYIWIIKTDPNLHPIILQKLKDMLQPYSNFYLVGSNKNYLITTTTPTKLNGTTTSSRNNMIQDIMTEVVTTEDSEIPSLGIAWRDGGEGYNLLQSKIYTGNITKLYQAIALRHAFPILETRLDSDDGLHQQYLQYVQKVAYERFFFNRRSNNDRRRLDENNREDREEITEDENASDEDAGDDGESDDEDDVRISPKSLSTTNVKWLYWCARRHMEWHINVNQTDTKNKSATRTDALAHDHDKYPMGILNPVEHSKLCITPGMTVGYNVGVDPKTVPVHPHDVLYRELVNSHDCIDDKSLAEDKEGHGLNSRNEKASSSSSCLELVDDLLFCAIRSRTLTSAGMRHVLLEKKYVPKQYMREKFWELAYLRFHFNMTEATSTKRYLLDHVADIAMENLHGQCTTGHSCKQQAQQDLEAYVKVAGGKK